MEDIVDNLDESTEVSDFMISDDGQNDSASSSEDDTLFVDYPELDSSLVDLELTLDEQITGDFPSGI